MNGLIDPQVFYKAADKIERDGWWRGTWAGTEPQFEPPTSEGCATCAGLAISHEAYIGRPGESGAHVEAFMRFVDPAYDPPGAWFSDALDRIYTWNDEQASLADVVAKLRECGRHYETAEAPA